MAAPERGAADPVNAVATSGIAGSRLRTMAGTKFAAIIQAVTGSLAQTSPPLYEKALAGLGELVGAAVLGRSGDDAKPDSVWLDGQELWVGFEAKSECKPDGEVSAAAAREAGGHINYAAASAGTATPPSSFVIIISPQKDVHLAARAVAGGRVYPVRPELIGDIASRLSGGWESMRIRPVPSGRPRRSQ